MTTYLERAVSDGQARMSDGPRGQTITYVAAARTERFSDPEEQVRAEYWAELIYRYGYPVGRIGVEITVPDRTPRDAADLVIFRDDELKRPYAVIECKREGITDTEFNQAVEQAAGNGTWVKLRADYVGVIAGLTRRFLDFSSKYGVLERETNIVADLPIEYGKPEDFKYTREGLLDIAPVSKDQLIVTLSKCHQSLWGGGKLSPPAAFGELCKLIFVKVNDEKAPRAVGDPYQFQIKTHESSERLASRIRALYRAEQIRDPDVFTENIKVDDPTLRTIVSHLEGISLSGTELDTKGVAFEMFMDGFFKGDFGQYFTPREVVRLAIGLTKPTSTDLVLDPACGSGGFLLHALDHVREEASVLYPSDPVAEDRHWHSFAQRNLFGLEINEELARVAKMNMILHDDGHSNILNVDALDRLDLFTSHNPQFAADKFDLILTNPPFGATITLSDRPYLRDYDLAHPSGAAGSGAPRKAQKTEILFIERVWQFLKPATGRAAIVLPDGVLSNSSLQYVREYILERFQVLAVVSLPQIAFSHYGAGVKSSVVVLRKRGPGEPHGDALVFMAMATDIGYDSSGRATGRNDLLDAVIEYEKFQSSPKSFVRG